MPDDNYYTPLKYIEMAREVMGSIDLDPASNQLAQEIVQARHYYTALDNGLALPWYGNIWLNPPYSRGLLKHFVDKVVYEDYDQAIILTNNSTDTAWFKRLYTRASRICFKTGRIKFYKEDGLPRNNPAHGQCFFYIGPHVQKFTDVFSKIGMVMI